MSSIPYDEPRCSVDMCAARITRSFTTSTGHDLALCKRHDEMFYASAIAAATPDEHGRARGRTRPDAVREFEFRCHTWSVA